jgi:hypothetical protein
MLRYDAESISSHIEFDFSWKNTAKKELDLCILVSDTEQPT